MNSHIKRRGRGVVLPEVRSLVDGRSDNIGTLVMSHTKKRQRRTAREKQVSPLQYATTVDYISGESTKHENSSRLRRYHLLCPQSSRLNAFLRAVRSKQTHTTTTAKRGVVTNRDPSFAGLPGWTVNFWILPLLNFLCRNSSATLDFPMWTLIYILLIYNI